MAIHLKSLSYKERLFPIIAYSHKATLQDSIRSITKLAKSYFI